MSEKPWLFQKGQSGNPGGKPGREKAPRVLQDLRAVYAGREPKTPGQKLLMDLREKNPREFLSQLRAAEREWLEARGEKEVKDERRVQIEELIDRILGEVANESG